MEARGSSRRELAGVLLLVVVILAVGASSVTIQPEPEPAEPENISEVRLVRPAPNGSQQLWPYTSRGRSIDKATLPINVVVREDPRTVRRLLVTGSRYGGTLYWNETAGGWKTGTADEDAVEINATSVRWGASHGRDRYTLLHTNDGGRWIGERYQLHDGTYFGSRYHLRLYEGGTGNRTWTAIQAHHEHWNWFQLRHKVGSLATAQHHVERDFTSTAVVADVSRERYANGGVIDADGWVTVIELREVVGRGPGPRPRDSPREPLLATVIVPALGIGLATRVVDALGTDRLTLSRLEDRLRTSRLTLDHVLLIASTACLVPAVRIGAVTAETLFPGASPVLIGAPFYLLLVVGLPACAVAFGRRIRAEDGFIGAAFGMGAGVIADYAYLQVTTLPFGAVVQQFALVVGLGLIAGGGSRWATDPLRRHGFRIVGLAVWVGGLLWPVFGLG